MSSSSVPSKKPSAAAPWVGEASSRKLRHNRPKLGPDPPRSKAIEPAHASENRASDSLGPWTFPQTSHAVHSLRPPPRLVRACFSLSIFPVARQKQETQTL